MLCLHPDKSVARNPVFYGWSLVMPVKGAGLGITRACKEIESAVDMKSLQMMTVVGMQGWTALTDPLRADACHEVPTGLLDAALT